PTAQNICASALDSDDAMHSVHGTPPGSTPSDVAGSDTHHDIMANTSSDSPSAYAIPSNTPPGSGPIRRGVSTAPVGNSVQNGRGSSSGCTRPGSEWVGYRRVCSYHFTNSTPGDRVRSIHPALSTSVSSSCRSGCRIPPNAIVAE